MENKHHLLMVVFGGFIAFMTMTSNASAANFNMRVCMDWRAEFTDAELGEDYLAENSLTYWTDSYGYYRISYASNDSTIDEGYLDIDGCSPYISATDGVEYRIRQGTRFSRNSSWVYLNTDNTAYDPVNYPEPADWPHGAVLYNTYYTPSGHSTGQYYTHNAPLGFQGYYSNMGAIVQRYMRYTNTLNIPANTHLHLRGFTAGSWYAGEDDNGYGAGTDQRVVINYFGNDHTYEKFRVAHEIGHATGAMTTSNLRGGSTAENMQDGDDFCNCDLIGGLAHCLNSREYIRAAESEGWAHFVAAEFFNARDDGNGYFGSYRDVTEPNPYPDGGGTTFHDAPWSVNLNTHKRWMEQVCDGTSMANHGVEWDWLIFYWQLWSNGDDRLDISDVKSIWPNNGSPDSEYNWTNSSGASITTSAQGYLAGDEETNFFTRAGNAGVDHGHAG